MIRFFILQSVLFIVCFKADASQGKARIKEPGKTGQASLYYRSATSGDWSSPATWQSSADSITWSPATLSPSAADNAIAILAGDTVAVSNIISLHQTTISGALVVKTGGVLNISHGSSTGDIDIQNNGVLQVLSTYDYSSTIITGAAVINVSTGGKIEIGDGSVAVGAGYETFATSAANVWNNASVFEWNSPADFVFSGTTYFPGALPTAIPKFIISKTTGSIGGAGDVTVNGLLTAYSKVTMGGNGDKNFRNGISGTDTITLNNITGRYNITSSNAELSGNLTLILFKDIHIKLGTVIPPGSIITLSDTGTQGFIRETGDIIIAANARLSLGSSATITNSATGNIIVRGTFATANQGGFTGTGSAIPSNADHVVLDSGSTVEYNAAGDQTVTSRSDYRNITFSGTGTKTLTSGFRPAGTVTISGSVIVDAKNHPFGDSSTNLTMTGTSRYITGGGSRKPDAQGAYNLAPGTTIEFALTSGTIIRLGSPVKIHYANIVVSGTNVSNISNVTGIAFQNGSTFTVKSGAVFKLQNAAGFTGSFNTAIDSTNSPTIILEDGSTIEYIGAEQIITGQTPYSNLTFSSAGGKTAPSGILTIRGNLSNSGAGVFIHNNGTVLFSNTTSAQNYRSVPPGFTFYNLKNSNTTGLSIDSDLAIEGTLSLDTSSVLTLNGNITLRSNAFTTASVAEVPASAIINYGTGLFIVERYFTPKRAWRFLSVPVNTVQSIKDAWQEGAVSGTADPQPGYGTQITDKVTPDAANGFDYYSANGPSVKKYDPLNSIWVGIAGTNIPIKTNEGIMTFVRGDRTANSLHAPLSPAILRSKGELYTGTLPVITVAPAEFTSIGNPYAAVLDMRKIVTANVDSNFYIWDPKLGGSGFGAYQTFIFLNNDFYPTPGFGSYGDPSQPYNYIQSGQAFFVTNSGSLNGSVSMMETAKAEPQSSLVNNTAVFRPVNTSTLQLLRTTLFNVNATSTDAVDGVLNIFGNDFSNAPGKEDAVKPMNFAENLAIKNNDKLLSVEKRYTINENDTIRLNLTRLKATSYRFIFNAANFNQSLLTAYLEDNYTGTHTLIHLNDTTAYNFSVTEAAGSWNPERFRILFSAAAADPLAIIFTAIKAYKQSGNILVDWKVEHEKNMKGYVVEKSINGQQFTIADTVKARGSNSSGSINYQWLDKNPIAGTDYYRIRSVNMNGEIQNSAVVNVIVSKGKPQIFVSPNPITGNLINLQLINQPKGNFTIKLLNTSGQVVYVNKINNQGGSSLVTIGINELIPKGIYLVKISGTNKDNCTFTISR